MQLLLSEVLQAMAFLGLISLALMFAMVCITFIVLVGHACIHGFLKAIESNEVKEPELCDKCDAEIAAKTLSEQVTNVGLDNVKS